MKDAARRAIGGVRARAGEATGAWAWQLDGGVRLYAGRPRDRAAGAAVGAAAVRVIGRALRRTLLESHQGGRGHAQGEQDHRHAGQQERHDG